MKIYIYNSQRSLSISKPAVENLIHALLIPLKIQAEELHLYFIGKKESGLMHAEFFQDSTPTDCMTFPLDPKGLLGEIFICPQIALEYSKKHHLNPYKEMTLYIIHALLHLVGYDDLSPEEKKKMRYKEKWCLNFLEKKGLLLDILPT